MLMGNLLKKLVRVPLNMSPETHIENLNARPSAAEAYAAAMSYPRNIVENRCQDIELDGHSAVIMPYATEDEVKIITDA